MPEDSPSIYTIMAERVANAILGKINTLIGGHNTNTQAHQDIREDIPSYTSDLNNDSGFITISSIPRASSATPLSDTQNGDVGTGTAWARSDHTHPKSSLYAEANHSHNIFDLNPSSQYGDNAIESGVDRDGAGLGYGSEFLIYNSQEQKFYYDKNGNADYDTGNELATLSDIPNISGKEDNANKVTSLSSSSTDTQYPSAKAVYDAINKQECYFDGDDFVAISNEQTITKTLTIVWNDNNNASKSRPRYLQATISDITAYLSEESDWSVSVPVDTENTYSWSVPAVLGYRMTSRTEVNNVTTVTLQIPPRPPGPSV